MSANLTSFVFGSLDPVGVVTVDKPPMAFWPMVASAAIFGYHGSGATGFAASSGAMAQAGPSRSAFTCGSAAVDSIGVSDRNEALYDLQTG